MKSLFKNLSPKNRYMLFNMFFAYIVQGVFSIGIGSLLPMLRAEYALSYRESGFLLSIHNVGNLASGLIAGILAVALGMKASYILFTLLALAGFALTLITGNPFILFLAFLATGLGRGMVTNYNNLAVSTIGKGSSALNNMLHSFFSIGALISPLIVLACTQNNPSGWRTATGVIICLLFVSAALSLKMDMGSVEYDSAERTADRSFRFLKERDFILPTVILFLYLCVEASVMGWIVSYLIETSIVSEGSTQLLNTVLWVTILAGRLLCVAVSGRISSPGLVRIMSIGTLIFLLVLLRAGTPALAILAVAGLGLSMSGMYGTVLACTGDVMPKYTFAIGAFILLSGIGASVMPAIVGAVAEHSGVRSGFQTLLIPAILLVIAVSLQRIPKKTIG